MNWPTDEEKMELHRKWVEDVTTVSTDLIELTINLIKAKNPEPEIVWPEGANWATLDGIGLYWYEYKPQFEDDLDCWTYDNGQCDEIAGIEYLPLTNHLMQQFKDKPFNECLIKKPGATE
jgi:hypothetical protein